MFPSKIKQEEPLTFVIAFPWRTQNSSGFQRTERASINLSSRFLRFCTSLHMHVQNFGRRFDGILNGQVKQMAKARDRTHNMLQFLFDRHVIRPRVLLKRSFCCSNIFQVRQAQKHSFVMMVSAVCCSGKYSVSETNLFKTKSSFRKCPVKHINTSCAREVQTSDVIDKAL